MYEACIIGCGQIGTEVMKALTAQYFTKDQIIGTDVNTDAIERLENEGFHMTNAMALPEAKAYFICVWDMRSVIDILQKIADRNCAEVIFVETTLDPSKYSDVIRIIYGNDLEHKTVIFPHRFNPNDPEHHVFNQKRLFGPMTNKAEEAGMLFLRKVMASYLIEYCEPKIAVLGKVVENAYRAMEIILAQEIKTACERTDIDFIALMSACNTKWNINIKEARDGVKGKCLPKDLALYNNFFCNPLSHIMEALNNDYISKHKV